MRHDGDPAKEYDFYQVIDKLEREAPKPARQKLQALGFSLGAGQGLHRGGQSPPPNCKSSWTTWPRAGWAIL